MFNITIVAGARPNIIKVAPLVRAAMAAGAEGSSAGCTLVYTGTPDDLTIEPSIYADLGIHAPDAYLGVDSDNLNELTGMVMSEFDRYLQNHPTDVVIVADDLASTMAVAIVTKKRGITLAHLVAGTRSFDITMPKEINRLVINGLSDLMFTAGMASTGVAGRQDAGLSKVYMVGNLLADNLRYNRSRLVRPAVFDELGTEPLRYILFTLNRKALIADRPKLAALTAAMSAAAGGMPIIAPLRETAAAVVRPMLTGMANVSIVQPLPYLEFGYAAANAAGIVTDSDNIAEEATFNGVPCATLNSYAEHIETVRFGTNMLVDEDPDKLAAAVSAMIKGQWKASSLPDRWDGRTAERILSVLKEAVKGKTTPPSDY